MARRAATYPDFTPIPLEITASFALETSHREIDSNNVVARIPGSEAPGETVIYTAHWDHLGTVLGMEGDNIYNGAFDNATGTTGLLALARAFAAEGRAAPQRAVPRGDGGGDRDCSGPVTMRRTRSIRRRRRWRRSTWTG